MVSRRRFCTMLLHQKKRMQLVAACTLLVVAAITFVAYLSLPSKVVPVSVQKQFPSAESTLKALYHEREWNHTRAHTCSHISHLPPKSFPSTNVCTHRVSVAVLSIDTNPKESFDDTFMYFWLGILNASSLTQPSINVGCVTFLNMLHDVEKAALHKNILIMGRRWLFWQFTTHNDSPQSLHKLFAPGKHAIGFLAKGAESCLPPCGHSTAAICAADPASFSHSFPYLFGLHIYQDCLLLDGERFLQWPLGPSVFTGFPATSAAMRRMLGGPVPTVAQRPMFLFSMVSGPFGKKYGREEAVKAAERVCSVHPCHVQGFYARALFFFGKFLEIVSPTRKEHPGDYLATQWATREYISGLTSSVFTLCPSGKNPESYRIYEAILAGSIPIIHDASVFENKQQSCPDSFQFLRRLNAPVIYVKHWDELDSVLELYSKDTARLQALQTEMLAWYDDVFVPTLRDQAVGLVMTHMS